MYSNDGGGVVGGFLVYVEDGGCVIKIMELDQISYIGWQCGRRQQMCSGFAGGRIVPVVGDSWIRILSCCVIVERN